MLALAAAPNPSSSAVAISFSVTAPSRVWLDIVEVGGRRVRSLLRGQLVVGAQRVSWDGRTSTGDHVAPGIYFASLRVGGASRLTKIV
jgi:hypothetical protein